MVVVCSMELSGIKITEKWFLFFPLLFAIYPIIFLYSHNVQELLFSQLYVPVAVALIATLICWLLLSFLIKDTIKTGVIITIFIISFFTYGVLFDWLTSLNFFTVKHRHILPIVLFITGYVVYFVYGIKNKEFFFNLAKILTGMILVLLIFSVGTAIPYEIKKMEYSHQNLVSTENQVFVNQSSVNTSSEYPDIYYIILDEYASSSTIKEIWGYDNSEFEDNLKNKGFFIAENSTSRYATTELSLDTSLNMEYAGPKISHEEFHKIILENKIDSYLGYPSIDEYKRIRENKVFHYLKSKNYTIISLDGFYSAKPVVGHMNADIHYDYIFEKKVILIDDFSFLVIEKSMLRSVNYLFQMNTMIGSYDVNRYSTQYIITKLKEIPKIKGPKFVYVHIMVPHTPFLFDQAGNQVNSENQNNWRDKEHYLNQYIFITNQIPSVVDNIITQSNNPPIIILQSDHGPRPFSGAQQGKTLDIPLIDMHKIFNAYYFPDGKNDVLYSNISPVNSFRVIFNKYFNENFTLLEDE